MLREGYHLEHQRPWTATLQSLLCIFFAYFAGIVVLLHLLREFWWHEVRVDVDGAEIWQFVGEQ